MQRLEVLQYSNTSNLLFSIFLLFTIWYYQVFSPMQRLQALLPTTMLTPPIFYLTFWVTFTICLLPIFPPCKDCKLYYLQLFNTSNLLFNIFLLLQFCYYQFFLHGKIANSITYNYLTPPIFYLTFSYFYNLLLDQFFPAWKDCKLYYLATI